jgi:hypothetical protein
MTTRLGWLIPFLLAGVVLTGLLISLAKHMLGLQALLAVFLR